MVADVTFSTESMVVIGALMASLTGALTYLYRALILSKDERLKEMESQRDSYREISDEALNHMEKVADRKRLKPKVIALVSIIPEHNSPTTRKQREDAELQTIRARLVAATLALDLPAREESPNGDEP